MLRPSAPWLIASLVVLVAACGKPKERGGMDAQFMTASMTGSAAPTGPERPLAADLAVEPVAMLVMFNRLKTPEKLTEALNKKVGQFSHLDLDKDNTPDPLTVAARDTPDGHAFEIRVRPATGEFVVATMMFDPEWSYVGHYGGLPGGAASTVGAPLPATPLPGAAAPLPTAPVTASTAPASVGAAAPVAAPPGDAMPAAAPTIGSAPPVQAVPTGAP